MLGALAQQGAKYERERHERAERQGAVGDGRGYGHSLVVGVALVLSYLRLHVPQR
jgi:hypothetical protein